MQVRLSSRRSAPLGCMLVTQRRRLQGQVLRQGFVRHHAAQSLLGPSALPHALAMRAHGLGQPRMLPVRCLV